MFPSNLQHGPITFSFAESRSRVYSNEHCRRSWSAFGYGLRCSRLWDFGARFLSIPTFARIRSCLSTSWTRSGSIMFWLHVETSLRRPRWRLFDVYCRCACISNLLHCYWLFVSVSSCPLLRSVNSCVFRCALHSHIVTVASSPKDVKDVGYVIVRRISLTLPPCLLTAYIYQNYDFPNNCEDYIHRIGRTGVCFSSPSPPIHHVLILSCIACWHERHLLHILHDWQRQVCSWAYHYS
jgi:hypothetical protein